MMNKDDGSKQPEDRSDDTGTSEHDHHVFIVRDVAVSLSCDGCLQCERGLVYPDLDATAMASALESVGKGMF